MDFNLQLSKYSIRDLHAMFKLGDRYTVSELDEKETAIRAQLVTGIKDETMKSNLARFLSDAKMLLLKEISGNGMIPTPPLYVPAKLEELVAGSVNPYERRSQTKCVCVDSVFRHGQLSTDFTYALPESIKAVVAMKLAAIEIPNAHTFSARNQANTFRLLIRDGPSGDEIFTVTLPEGSYGLSEMTTVLTTAILTQVSYVIGVVTAQATTIRFRDVGEGDSIYDSSGPVYAPSASMEIDFGVDGKILYTTAGWTLGYRVSTAMAPAVSETAFTGPNYVFLDVDDFQNNFQTDTVISTNGLSYLGKNLLGRIALPQCQSVCQVFQKREYFGPVRLDKLHFRLLTRFGEVVDLGAADFSFVLEFTTVYS